MRKVLFLLSLIVTVGAWGQQRDTVEYRSPYRDLRPVKCVREAETNGRGDYHGKFVMTGVDKLNSGQRNDLQQYTESRTYSDGVLQGGFSQKYMHQGSGQISGRFTISHNWMVEGRFADGLPDGTWTFSVNTKYSSASEKENTQLKEVVEFEKGRVVSLADQKGNRLRVDAQGRLSGIGTTKEGKRVILTNSIITNTYVDLLGDTRPMTNEQTFMLRKVLDGEWTIFELADHGYALDWNEMYLAQWSRFADHSERYARIGSLAKGYTAPTYSIRIAQLREVQLVEDAKAVEYYMQSNLAQFDAMMTVGYYWGPYGRRYFSSKGAEMVMERWERDQKQLLNRRLTAVAKDQADVTWNEFIEDCKGGDNRTMEMFASPEAVTTRMIEERLRPLFPIVGHRVDSIVWRPRKGYEAHCVINKMGADSVGYESYVVRVPHNLNGYVVLDQMEPYTYRRVANAWDTVYAYERQLKERHEETLSKMGQLKRIRVPYARYYDSIVADRTTDPKVRMDDLRELYTLQQNLVAEVPMMLQAEQIEVQLKQKLVGFKRIARAYREYCEANRPEWDDTMETVENYLQYQQRLQKAVAVEDLNLIERKSRRTNPIDLLVPDKE